MQPLIIHYFKLFLPICFILTSFTSFSQDKRSGEIGIFAGGSFYLGDINKIPLRAAHVSAGAFYRHTFDTRFAVTGKFTYAGISGNDAKSNNAFQTDRGFAFTTSLYELQGSGEFNFMPFLPGGKKYKYTPYVFAGLAATYNPIATSKYFIDIPFGIGAKYNLNSNFILSAFAEMHKTFIDNIDFDYHPPTPNRQIRQYGYAGNKDWYSVFGVCLSYKIKYRIKCPAFD